MKFIRLACLALESFPDDHSSIRLPGEINDFTIKSLGNYKREEEILSLWQFHKTLTDDDYRLTEGTLSLDTEFLDACHQLIRFFASYVSVIHQIKLTICSPIPSFALVPETDVDQSILRSCQGMDLHQKAFYSGDFTFEIDGKPFDLVRDRADGLEALSEALRLNSELAKYREYMRLFEIAFAHAGVGLYKPLLRFLVSGGGEFAKVEVREWFDGLRSRAIHGDKDEPIFGFEIAKSMQRMTLAAYDVLFNKENWRSHDHSRRNGMVPISGPGFLTQGKEGVLALRLFDDFGVFPMNANAAITSPPEEWWHPNRSNHPLNTDALKGAG